MRATVIQQDDGSGQGERARRDLQQQDEDDAGPDKQAAGRGRRGGGARQHGQVGREEVGDREEDEEVAEGVERAEPGVDGGVEEELQRHAEHA